jgi:NTP pyrophosphatase (non-canonical NTP hydrolase)
MKEQLVKLAEEASELSFAALKYRVNPSNRNLRMLIDELADVLGCADALELEVDVKRRRQKAANYRKLKEKK